VLRWYVHHLLPKPTPEHPFRMNHTQQGTHCGTLAAHIHFPPNPQAILHTLPPHTGVHISACLLPQVGYSFHYMLLEKQHSWHA
jgi:hypothetical protein